MAKKTSNSRPGFGQRIGFTLVRGAMVVAAAAASLVGLPAAQAKAGVTGQFHVQCVSRNGDVKWEHTFSNGVTNEGLDRILNTMFDGTTQIGAGAWYLGLIDATGGPTLAAGDTYQTHGGWSELDTVSNTVYSETTRPAWNPAPSTAQSSSNTTTVDFTFIASATVAGIFLSSVNTKGDSTSGANNVLWATGLFPGGNQSVVNGDVLKITYTVNAAAA